MPESVDKKKILQVFKKVEMHRLIEQLIRQFSTNKNDIRHIALAQADLSNCRNVLELGCAFGSFTEALQGKLHEGAKITGLDIVPQYESFFIDACHKAGYAGEFSSSGINQIKDYPRDSFDLIICSYALYFFPQMIPDIVRLLTKDGIFIAITHCEDNMQELVRITKLVMRQNGLHDEQKPLPVENIVRQFSGENGRNLLNPFFSRIMTVDFNNSLYFRPADINFFAEYFHFKSPFFLMGTKAVAALLIDELMDELYKAADENSFVTMCKNDRIFVCFDSLPPEKRK
ncbi:MAG TPA: class I SAM-dependent methyltransferase [Smithellaceae bacterium]|nr:class I SAM-dependent methyltransferase [Smithellaceae bacterium]